MVSGLISYLGHVVRFAPAILFLMVARLGPGDTGTRWTHAYIVGGVLAVFHAIWLLRTNKKSGIALGVDAFLMIGAVLLLVSPLANQYWGEQLGVSAVLLCALLVGILGIVLWPPGLDSEDIPPERAGAAVRVMLLITAVALAIALVMPHGSILANVALILLLVVTQGFVRKRAMQA